MALGERLNYFRRKSNLTMKALGMMLGFDPKSADVRISQYEKGTKMPKPELIQSIANVLGISPLALRLPDIDSYDSLMHTLFALEDIYGLTIHERDGICCLQLNPDVSPKGGTLSSYFESWAKEKQKLVNKEISLEEYDDWRYCFPRDDGSVIRAKVLSPQLSEELLQGLANGELTIQEAPKRRKTRKNFTRKGLPSTDSQDN